MYRRLAVLAALLAGLCAVLPAPVPGADASPGALHLTLRTRVQPFKGSDDWREVTFRQDFPAGETAIVICDMWDDHWCKNAARRCAELAKKMAPVVDSARERGVFIIHAPSECMDFYKDSPARKRMQEAPKTAMPRGPEVAEPALPCDTSADGGCDDDPPSKFSPAWKRQHEAIHIDEARDGISDKGAEVYAVLKQRGIKNLLVMGVHTNMCILNRSFAIKAMTRAGLRCVLVRDLTDAMYNPKSRPFVAHDEGTERIIRHIEQYWCPTATSADLR